MTKEFRMALSSVQTVSTVIVVDDDQAVRSAVRSLFRSLGMQVIECADAKGLLAAAIPDHPCCIVLDVHMKEENGLAVQARLREEGVEVPIVFLSGCGDVPMTATVMKAGAITFISKPFRTQDLIDAVNEAIGADAQRRARVAKERALRGCYDSLTPREREAMLHLVRGMTNKETADSLDISPSTVKIYRAQAMQKMSAGSFADLIIMARSLGLVDWDADNSSVILLRDKDIGPNVEA